MNLMFLLLFEQHGCNTMEHHTSVSGMGLAPVYNWSLDNILELEFINLQVV